MSSLKGHLLIASPELTSPFFGGSVTLMLEHGEHGAMGITLNRPTGTTIADIADDVFGEPFEWDKAIHLGGPVPGPLMVVHADDGLADAEVIPGVFVTVEADKLRDLLRGRPEPSLIVVNNAGWAPGQLEGEFGRDAWLTLPATSEYLFEFDPAELWDIVLKAAGTQSLADFLGLKGVPDDPSLN